MTYHIMPYHITHIIEYNLVQEQDNRKLFIAIKQNMKQFATQ